MFSVIISSCGPEEVSDPVLEPTLDFDERLLYNRWQQSWVAAPIDNKMLFRPSDYSDDLPLGLFNIEFHLLHEDSCQYLQLSPTDAHFMAGGSWRYGTDAQLTIWQMDGSVYLDGTLIELEADKLVVQIK